jgi:hypothetical protein
VLINTGTYSGLRRERGLLLGGRLDNDSDAGSDGGGAGTGAGGRRTEESSELGAGGRRTEESSELGMRSDS